MKKAFGIKTNRIPYYMFLFKEAQILFCKKYKVFLFEVSVIYEFMLTRNYVVMKRSYRN